MKNRGFSCLGDIVEYTWKHAGKSWRSSTFFENLIFRGSLYEHFLSGRLISNVGDVMERVIFSLERKVDVGGVGLILDESKYSITEQVIPERKREAKSYYRKLRNVFFYLLDIRILLKTALNE